MISLLIADASETTNLWCALWFQVSFAASVLAMIVGLYVLAGSYIPLWMPRTLEERRSGAPSVDEGLTDAVAAGRALLTEAAELQPGNIGIDDDLLRRAGDWVDDVSDALAEHDEREMQKRWMNNPRWSQERPDPITREQWDRYVVSEIRERLALLDKFRHQLRTRA